LKSGKKDIGVGVCGQAALSLVGSVEGCYLVTKENYGQIVTLASNTFENTGLSIEGMITNAQNIEDVSQYGICFGGGAGGIGGASVTVCASLNEDQTYSGTISILPGVTVGAPGAGASYTYGYTLVAEKGTTPRWARSALHEVSRIADPDYGEIYEAFTRPDQWGDRIGGWIYDVLFGGGEEMAPGPIGEDPSGVLY
jgi:hypothetical protein